MEDQDFELGTAYESDGEGIAPTWATGVYIVTAVKLEDGGRSKFPKQDKDGNVKTDDQGNPIFEPRWKWHFQIDEVDSRRASDAQDACVGQVLYRWTSRSLGRGPSGPSNCRAYIEALIGRELDGGERPRASWFLGRQARATLTAKEGKVAEFALMPLDDQPADVAVGTTTQPAALPDNRQNVMQALHDVEDRRDLARLKERIRALRLDTDDEIVDIYNLTYSRVVGNREPADAAQPPLPY